MVAVLQISDMDRSSRNFEQHRNEHGKTDQDCSSSPYLAHPSHCRVNREFAYDNTTTLAWMDRGKTDCLEGTAPGAKKVYLPVLTRRDPDCLIILYNDDLTPGEIEQFNIEQWGASA